METYASKSRRREHQAQPACLPYPLTLERERSFRLVPITGRQLSALATAVTRELGWGLACVARDVRRWWRLAERIPDRTLREHALMSLREKRPNTDGLRCCARCRVIVRSSTVTAAGIATRGSADGRGVL